FELNKIASAVLGSVLLLMVINEIGNFVVRPQHMERSILDIAVEEDGATGVQTAAAEPEQPLAVLLAQADAEKGARGRASARPATPSRKAARTRSARTCSTCWVGTSLQCPTSRTPTP